MRLGVGLASFAVAPEGQPHIDVDVAPAQNFGFAEDRGSFASEVHSHARHQLLYASEGSLTLFASGLFWFLPAGRAAWIPPGVPHKVEARGQVALRTVYFANVVTSHAAPTECRVFQLPRLGEELLFSAMAYDAEASPTREADLIFSLLAELATRWAAEPSLLYMQVPQSPELRRAVTYLETNLATRVRVTDVAKEARLSVRSLHRQFKRELGLSFRAYDSRLRVVCAMASLAEPGSRVTSVAMNVGFESFGAFARAFRRIAGESPSAYRERFER